MVNNHLNLLLEALGTDLCSYNNKDIVVTLGYVVKTQCHVACFVTEVISKAHSAVEKQQKYLMSIFCSHTNDFLHLEHVFCMLTIRAQKSCSLIFTNIRKRKSSLEFLCFYSDMPMKLLVVGKHTLR